MVLDMVLEKETEWARTEGSLGRQPRRRVLRGTTGVPRFGAESSRRQSRRTDWVGGRPRCSNHIAEHSDMLIRAIEWYFGSDEEI